MGGEERGRLGGEYSRLFFKFSRTIIEHGHDRGALAGTLVRAREFEAGHCPCNVIDMPDEEL